MQAALEAMQVYGFSEDLILKKLKELLNVCVLVFVFLVLSKNMFGC